jgi:hypothetical protein
MTRTLCRECGVHECPGCDALCLCDDDTCTHCGVDLEKRCFRCLGTHEADPNHPYIDCWCPVCHPARTS